MRQEREFDADVRSSALWGKGGRGERRSSALWGKGGRGAMTIFVALTALVLPLAAGADDDTGQAKGKTYVAPGVYQAAQNNSKLRVIIQSTAGARDADDAAKNTGEGSVLKRLDQMGMVVAELPAGRIQSLAKREGLTVTLDAPVKKADYTSTQLWPHQSGVAKLWGTTLSPGPQAPGIAVIDSGIDRSRLDFDLGMRVIARQVFGDSSGGTLDGRGHGTFVAGIAAGSAPGYAGASPNSNLVDLDVMNDQGMARTSDVIAACEWVLQNKSSKGIRIVNMSLHSSAVLSIRYHPLNRAVEKLWFSGVTVVAAAGNYGVAGGPSGVRHAPGNDPFVITVGAADIDGSVSTNDDHAAPWSAYGYTLDGFAKPELGAPGRYVVGPVPMASTLPLERPTSVVAPGYMQLSGTSFAAPMVSAAAAQVLAAHPSWTPDQVKGALMLTAKPAGNAAPGSVGVGVVNAAKAVAVTNPPNPNAALNRFVASASGGSGKVFDAASWASAAQSDASWASASWASASWASASWASASWASASWASASWSSASWANASWASSSYADNAEGDASAEGEYLDPAELSAVGILLP